MQTKNKEFNINNIKVIQAPLAGISDNVFRKLIRKYSKTCLLTTEMISSEMLCNNPNPRIIEFEEFEYPLAFQLVGHKIDKMVRAAQILAPFASVLDINCGCPVKKVVTSNDVCAMMRTPELAAETVYQIKEATGLPVSVKFRLGWSSNEENYIEFAKTLEKAGASYFTLHARTRSQMYQGHSDWNKIKLLNEEVNVPVFANGDIKTIQDTKECLELTKCHGVSIGRGIIGDFTLPFRVENYINNQKIEPQADLPLKISMLKEHLQLEVQRMGEINGVKFMRKFYNYYIASVKNASKYRANLVVLEKQKDIEKILDEILSLYNKDN